MTTSNNANLVSKIVLPLGTRQMLPLSGITLSPFCRAFLNVGGEHKEIAFLSKYANAKGMRKVVVEGRETILRNSHVVMVILVGSNDNTQSDLVSEQDSDQQQAA